MSEDKAVTLGRLIAEFQRSAFRLEARSVYAVDAEADFLAAYVRGEPKAPPTPEIAEWVAMLRQLPATGRTMTRVHAIAGPLTPYLRYELDWGYGFTADAGEDVRILHRGSWAEMPFGAEPPDFWLLDDTSVGILEYASDGEWLDVLLVTDPSEVATYQRLRDSALGEAIPLRDYLAALRASPLDPLPLLQTPARTAS
ncbi:MAG: hypothetical protein QOE72_2813 [Chloroflexota bacterium]|jgi:hypothetical protein|nr:hypothetical protein [Chloroflexota bacterium]